MLKWLAILLLFLMLVSYSVINTMWVFKLQEQVEELQSYKDYFIRQLNVRNYPEVLGMAKK